MYYVYILQDDENAVYVGFSEDLKNRLLYHQSGNVSTTQKYSNPKLVWYCAFPNKKIALAFEKYLKAGSGHAFARKHLIKQNA